MPIWNRDLTTIGPPSVPFHLPRKELHDPLGVPSNLLDPADIPAVGGLDAKLIRDHFAADREPIPALEDREYYFVDRDMEWWVSGIRDVVCVKKALALTGGPTAGGTFLEFGAATGRVIRHMDLVSPGCKKLAFDANVNHVEWLQRFSPGIVASVNSFIPPLPVPDASIDVAMAFSVFTHIDVLESTWLSELRRVLRPGGLAYVTVHTEHVWDGIAKGEFESLHTWLKDADNYDGSGILTGPMPYDRFVFGYAQWHASNVFHTVEYVKKTWSKYLDVIAVWPQASGYQAGVVLKS